MRVLAFALAIVIVAADERAPISPSQFPTVDEDCGAWIHGRTSHASARIRWWYWFARTIREVQIIVSSNNLRCLRLVTMSENGKPDHRWTYRDVREKRRLLEDEFVRSFREWLGDEPWPIKPWSNVTVAKDTPDYERSPNNYKPPTHVHPRTDSDIVDNEHGVPIDAERASSFSPTFEDVQISLSFSRSIVTNECLAKSTTSQSIELKTERIYVLRPKTTNAEILKRYQRFIRSSNLYTDLSFVLTREIAIMLGLGK